MSTNGSPENAPKQPSLNVLAQYVKDLSFENPNSPRSLMPQAQPPNIGLQVDLNAQGLSETDVEVELKIEGQAGEGQGALFKFELSYAGVFRIENIAEPDRTAVIFIECPRLLFPYARQIISDAVRNGGFPPLMIDPIDFVSLYRQRVAMQQEAGSTTVA